MKLGIVGHAQEKFTQFSENNAKLAIQWLIQKHRPEAIVSGHSPMGGVDIWAEQIAAVAGIPMIVHALNRWAVPGGFKERNLAIVADSDLVMVLVVDELPPGFKGMRFNGGCYHCLDRHPPHVKSGACWTAWEARKLGKSAEWIFLPQQGRPA